MQDYRKQVTKDHYFQDGYEDMERFVSYYHQQRLIKEAAASIEGKPTLLEVGPGNGFLEQYLRLTSNIAVSTSDIAEDLHPTYVSDITALSATIQKRFDIVCCFEVLEHIQFSDVEKAVEELSRISKRFVILSVPQANMYMSVWAKIPLVRPRKKIIWTPFPMRHTFDGQHYWELGKKGYGYKRFRAILERHLTIRQEFTEPLNHYHRFFVCEK